MRQIKPLYYLLLVFFFVVSTIPLFSEEFTLPDLIKALKENNAAYRMNEAVLKKGLNNYLANKAIVYPVITGKLPFGYSGSQEENTVMGIDKQDKYSISSNPEINISQLLPTAGVLSAVFSDSLLMNRIRSIEPDTGIVSMDPVWSNSFKVSANLSQPLFFKDAYTAALTANEKSYACNRLAFLKTRNSLVLQAVQDFYKIKQSLFSLDLIRSRLQNDRESYKKIEQEYNMGLLTLSDLYRGKTALIKSETDLLEAEQKQDSILGFFTAGFGLDGELEITSSVKEFPIGKLEYTEIIPEILEGNSGIIIKRYAVDIQQASMITTQKNIAPVLSLGGGLTFMKGLTDKDESLTSYSVSLGISASLFDGGTNDNTMKKMEAELHELEASFYNEKIRLENEAGSLLNSIERAEQLTGLYEFQIEAAKYEYEKGLKDLELGQITKKNLSELQIELENAMLGKQQNIINVNFYYLQIIALKGVDLCELSFFRKDS